MNLETALVMVLGKSPYKMFKKIYSISKGSCICEAMT